MAYMNQENKKRLAPKIKAVLKKYGMKGTLSVRNHSTLVCNIKSGDLDIIGNANEVMRSRPNDEPFYREYEGHINVNVYWIDRHYTGKVQQFLRELVDAMNDGNWDKSDIQTDYFNVGWYIDINVGSWDKPYLYNKSTETA